MLKFQSTQRLPKNDEMHQVEPSELGLTPYSILSKTEDGQKYLQWCNWLDRMGNVVGLYQNKPDTETTRRRLHKILLWIATLWAVSGWMFALVCAINGEGMPIFFGFYEIRSDGEKKDIWEAIGTTVLCLIPAANLYFRPVSFKARFYGGVSECCPLTDRKLVKEMADTTRRHTMLALSLPAATLGVGMAMNIVNLVKSDAGYDPALKVLDAILVFGLYSLANSCVGHTSMSFALRMRYYHLSFKLLKIEVQDKDKEFDPLAIMAKFDSIQLSLLKTAKTFGPYLGTNTVLCVLASSLFAGRLPATVEGKDFNPLDLAIRLFYQAVFILPLVYNLALAATVGTSGMKVIRHFLRHPVRNLTPERVEKHSYVINHFSLKSNVGDVGVRIFGTPLVSSSVSQLLSFWATLLALTYSMGRR